MAENSKPQSESKPLGDKTDAELKREAKARLKRLDPIARAAVMEGALKTKVRNRPHTGFSSFLKEKGVVGLAVGFAIGSQSQLVVKGFISDFVDPFFKLVIPGNQTLSQHVWNIYGANFKWGDMVYQLLDFLFIVFIIYLVIKLFKLDQLDKKN